MPEYLESKLEKKGSFAQMVTVVFGETISELTIFDVNCSVHLSVSAMGVSNLLYWYFQSTCPS